jgi:crossover junction endodeoxyribonuclease RuvC
MKAPTPPPVRILGIDPGLRSTGFGLIDKTGNKLAYVASGCITTDAAGSLPQRIKTILDGLVEIIATYQPQQAAVEIVFVNVNPQSTLLLGQARGAAIAALVTANLPVAEYSALQVKLALPGNPSADAADALACAIAHAHGGQGMGTLATAGRRVKGGRLI